MITLNFQEKLPEFGTLNYNKKLVTTEEPHKIFVQQRKSKGTTSVEIECSCPDPDCKNRLLIFYNGLNRYFSSRNIGSDTEINIHPQHDENEHRANNIMWNPTEESTNEFIEFIETAKEAIIFKKELLTELFAELQVYIQNYGEIQIAVRKDDKGIHLFLYDIPVIFTKVPLLSESKNYRECLGLIATLPLDTDLSEVKNDWAKRSNPFFTPIIEWVNLLAKENELSDIGNPTIWVMPE